MIIKSKGIVMSRSISTEKCLHYAISSVGGYLGAYALVNHCDLFANAQTANLIRMAGKIFTGNYEGLIYILLAALAYFTGNALYVVMNRYLRLDMRLVSMLFTTGAVVLIGLMPLFSNDYLALLPIMFVTPIQWNSFVNTAGYASSTIFSTNNFRQATMSLTLYIMDKDKAQLQKTKFFWLTLLSFNTGAGFGSLASLFYGSDSIWFCLILIAMSFAVYLHLKSFQLSSFRSSVKRAVIK